MIFDKLLRAGIKVLNIFNIPKGNTKFWGDKMNKIKNVYSLKKAKNSKLNLYEGPGSGSPPGFKVDNLTEQNFPPKQGSPGIVSEKEE